MPKVIADITMSLDGFVTGEGADEQHGLGDAPELHTWVMQQDAVDTEVLAQATAQSGAVVMGRRLFDLVNGPTAGARTWGTVPIRRGRRHSSWSLTRRGKTSGWSATWDALHLRQRSGHRDRPGAVRRDRWRRRDHGRRRHYRPGARTGPRRGSRGCTSPRWHLVAARRCSNQGRARCTGNARSACRGTPCTSPTNACRSRRRGATSLQSSTGDKKTCSSTTHSRQSVPPDTANSDRAGQNDLVIGSVVSRPPLCRVVVPRGEASARRRRSAL